MAPEGLRDKVLDVMVANAHAAENMSGACQGESFPDICPNMTGGPGPHMTAGLFAIKWFLLSLGDGGMNDLAYEALSNPSFPSPKFMMSNPFSNATTFWESWSFSDSRYSHNHPMFSSTEVWLLQSVAGIQPHPAAKGMDHVLIKPSPPSALESASASYATPRGVIAVEWVRGSGSTFNLTVSVPPNVRATVHVPCLLHRCSTVREGDESGERGEGREGVRGGRVVPLSETLAWYVVEVGSGLYSWSS